jgi:hypothetical protein
MARMPERITFRSELDLLLHAAPFAPFEIVMVSGDRYRIDDPAEVLVGEEIIHILPRRRTRHSILRFNEVSSLDVPDFESP